MKRVVSSLCALVFFSVEVDADASGLSLKQDPFTYSGAYTDSESGQQYLQARYYNPRLMRFDSWDTEPLSNRYGYGNANPIMNDDPTGHMPGSIMDITGLFDGTLWEEVLLPVIAALLAPETGGVSELTVDVLVIPEITGTIVESESQAEPLEAVVSSSLRAEESLEEESPAASPRLSAADSEEESEEPPLKKPKLEDLGAQNEAPAVTNASPPAQDISTTPPAVARTQLTTEDIDAALENVGRVSEQGSETLCRRVMGQMSRIFPEDSVVVNAELLEREPVAPGDRALLRELSNVHAAERYLLNSGNALSDAYKDFTTTAYEYHKMLFGSFPEFDDLVDLENDDDSEGE